MIGIDLSDKVAVVTGGASDLGAPMCRTLSEAGAAVVVHYHQGCDRAEALAAELRAAGRMAIAVGGDVTSADDVQRLRDEAVAAFGPVSIIVNNAVSSYPWKPVLEQSAEAYESVFRSCVLQNVLMAKAFVPDMIDAKWGRVIAINTECTMTCLPTVSAYVAGKGGQDRVLRVLAREVGEHGITVNQVAPGYMVSPKQPVRKDDPGEQHYTEGVALKHRGDAQEIANAVLFLASDLAAFITGCYLPVTGGNIMPAI